MTPTTSTFRPVDLISSVALIALCWLLPHYSGLPIFIYPLIVVGIIWIYLRWVARETFADLLFDWKKFRIGAVVTGVVVAISLSMFFKYAWDPFIHVVLPAAQNDVSAFAAIRHNPVNYAITLLLGIAVGGFYEEIVFHGFIFTRLEKLFRRRAASPIAFVLTAVLFGAYHFQQGLGGVLLSGIAGMVYHLLTLRHQRNLWYGICCHACFDVIGLTLIYLGYVR